MTMTAAETKPRTWWGLFLITGALWMAMSLIVLRFNTASLVTIAILFGVIAMAAGVNEFIVAAAVPTWKPLHYILGGLFVVTGIVALFNPGATFWALAAIIGWYLLFKGTLDIVVSAASRHENEMWWLGVIAGSLEVAAAFWATGGYGRRVFLLVAWVAIACMLRGVTEIVTAFRLRRLSLDAMALAQGARAGYAAATTREWAARPTAPTAAEPTAAMTPGGPGAETAGQRLGRETGTPGGTGSPYPPG